LRWKRREESWFETLRRRLGKNRRKQKSTCKSRGSTRRRGELGNAKWELCMFESKNPNSWQIDIRCGKLKLTDFRSTRLKNTRLFKHCRPFWAKNGH
jgi:hypothetical protein